MIFQILEIRDKQSLLDCYAYHCNICIIEIEQKNLIYQYYKMQIINLAGPLVLKSTKFSTKRN